MAVPHTPGPWKAGRGVGSDPRRCFVAQDIPGSPPWVIAEIENGAPGDCLDTEFANATLIAAAPDLYQVAVEAPVLSKFHGARGFDVEGFIAAYEEWNERRRAAIAKAEAPK